MLLTLVRKKSANSCPMSDAADGIGFTLTLSIVILFTRLYTYMHLLSTTLLARKAHVVP